MRILFVNEYFVPSAPGGAEWSLFHLARSLGERGHAVAVLTCAPAGEDEEKVREYDRRLAESGGVSVRRFAVSRKVQADNAVFPSYVFGNPLFHRRYGAEIKKEIRAFGPDVVHAQGYDSYEPALNASRSSRLPCVATVRDYRALCPVSICLHSNDEAPAGCSYADFRSCCQEYLEDYELDLKYFKKQKHDLRRMLEWRNSREAGRALASMTGAVFVSHRILEIYRGAELAPKNSQVIYNLPAPLEQGDKLNPPDRAKEYCAKPYIAFAGRYSIGKGAKVLSEAMKIVGLSRPDIHCLVAGRREAQVHSEKMMFLGTLSPSALSEVFQKAEMVVLPSRWPEPLSRVLIEASLLGTPIVATDAGGSAEVIVDGYNGRLAPRNDPHALATAILEMLNSSEGDKRRMKQSAKKRALEIFDSNSILQQMENFYLQSMDEMR